MGYRLKVSFRSDGRTYSPGDILPDGIPASDLAYLRKKGFVEPVDAVFPAGDTSSQEADGFRSMGIPGQKADGLSVTGTGDDGMGISFPELGEGAQEDVKTPEEIQKMRTKDEVYAYAQSIGLDLGEDYREESLKGLQEQVISFQGGAG